LSRKRTLVSLFDRRVVRRLTLAPVVAIAAVVGIALSPVIVFVVAGSDFVTRQPRWRRTRLAVLILGALTIELVGMLTSLLVWILTGFNRVGSSRWRWHLHRSYMGRYTSALLTLIARVIGTTIEWRDRADLDHGPVVLLARHTSFFDALIPATVLSRRNSLLAHHVVTHGLQYAPCIDIVGHRFPNRFIKRSVGEGSSELPHIEAIGSVLDDRSAAIIFPEGTFRNPARFERVVRRLRRREPELADRAADLDHVLPPRANGTLALLEGAEHADVVVCTNTGFEKFGTIRAIRDQPWSDTPIIIETWRIRRADIPSDLTEFSTWLFDEFVKIDAWVEAET